MGGLTVLSLKALQMVLMCSQGEKHYWRVTVTIFGLEPSWWGAAVEETAKHTCLGKLAFLTVLNRSWQMLPVSEHLGHSDLSGLQGVLFEMPVFDFSAENRHNDIYSTLTLCESQEFDKNQTNKTPKWNVIHFRGDSMEGGAGHILPPTTQFDVHWVDGTRRNDNICNYYRTARSSLNWLQMLKPKAYTARV